MESKYYKTRNLQSSCSESSNEVQEVNLKWAGVLTDFIDSIGGDGSSLWEWRGKCPTPEVVVVELEHMLKYLEKSAAETELAECVKLVKQHNTVIAEWLYNKRNPKFSTKKQALESIKILEQSENIDPILLGNIVAAIQKLPDKE